MDKAQGNDLEHFLGDWNQSEKLSEVKPPLTPSLTSLFLTQVPSQILLEGYLQPADLQSNCSETIYRKHKL